MPAWSTAQARCVVRQTSEGGNRHELFVHAPAHPERDQLVDRLWHIPFNQLKETNEKLVRGREDLFFGADFSASAGTHKLPEEVVNYYVAGLASSPEALRGSFQLYRAFGATAAQNEQRKTRRLPMPVLAMGGAESSGAMVKDTMKLTADDVQGLVIPDCGHWLAEQAPAAMLAALTAFLSPYRETSDATRSLHEVRR